MEKGEKLKAELTEIAQRIDEKIKKLYMSKKLPFERISQGKRLHFQVLYTLEALDKGDVDAVKESLDYLQSKGLKIKNGI